LSQPGLFSAVPSLMGKATTVLIVDDEADLLSTLEYNLEQEGYVTRTAATGAAAIIAAQQEPIPDIVLLDVMLPDCSGKDVCRTLRQLPALRDVPIIMVTARGEEIDRVVGFEVGADDYVVKPFSIRELVLRMRAILRRATTTTEGDAVLQAVDIRFGALRVELERHRATIGGGPDATELPLTALEFRLLTTFMQRRGRVLTREVLLADVWGLSPELTTRTVDTHVKRLREKLGAAGEAIETVRGVGYRFSESTEPRA
jgi:two-component system, OmpR family, phosphate regulon response regulator PhoB